MTPCVPSAISLHPGQQEQNSVPPPP
ncbi:hypothetical protein CPC197_1462, partial [Chlamydia psittaci C1/97]